MGQLEEAVTLFERALTHSPENVGVNVPLSAAYALLGRAQDAQAALDDYRKIWPRPPHLHMVMNFWPFKDQEVADRLADGLLKAGLPGQPTGYFKIHEETKLTAEEVKELVFGQTMTGINPYTKQEWWSEIDMDGEAKKGGGKEVYRGKYWIEENSLCSKYYNKYEEIKYCGGVYRNIDGTPENKDEFYWVNDFGIYTWSVEN
jgi:hypothetical protein